MAYSKIGFHTAGSGGNPTGVATYTQALAAANIPACIVCADGVVGIMDALLTDSHLLFRVVRDGSEHWAVPDYNLTPHDAAIEYRQRLLPFIHPTVSENRDKIWVILGNELDKNRADWIGRWAYESAQIWNADGYRVAFFGWSSGEPEPEHWQLPGMRQFLALAAARPETVAVALHEYSYDVANIRRQEGWLVGRFERLFEACSAMGLARPTVFITEWGWTHNDAPPVAQAMADIEWAAELYAYYRNVKGVAMWYLGPDFGDIANKIQPLIAPVTQATLSWGFLEESEIDPPDPPPPPPPPGGQHKAILVKIPQEVTVNEWQAIAAAAFQNRHTLTASHDDTLTILRGGNSESYVKVAFPGRPSQVEAIDLIENAGYGWEPLPGFLDVSGPFLANPLTRPFHVTSRFNAPRNYTPPFHEGLDLAANINDVVVAALPGVVNGVRNTDPGGYGKYVRVRSEINGVVWTLWYTHLNSTVVQVGKIVSLGDPVGFAGMTGNATGPHLHLTVQKQPGGLSGYVIPSVVDPAPLLGLPSTTLPGPGQAPPPAPAPTIDLLPYLRGDGHLYEVQNAAGGQERFQTQAEGSKFFQTKNAHWEELYFDNTFIYRDRDTSPGGGRFYRLMENGQPGSAWIPRHWEVGAEFTRSLRVQFFNKSDCSPSAENSGDVTNTMRFVARYSSYTFRTGITLPDVVELLWVNGGERYFYTRNFGLCAWERTHQDPNTPAWSAISEIHAPGARPDNVRETGCFS